MIGGDGDKSGDWEINETNDSRGGDGKKKVAGGRVDYERVSRKLI